MSARRVVIEDLPVSRPVPHPRLMNSLFSRLRKIRLQTITRAIALVSIVLGSLAMRSSAADTIDYNRDIRPILSERCYACHGPDQGKREAGLRLDLKDEAFKQLESDGFAIVPGKPDESKLLARIAAADDDERMPPKD